MASSVSKRRFSRYVSEAIRIFFVVFGSECVQGMLESVAKLPQNVIGNIGWVLDDKITANTFGPDQTSNLFDFVHQRFKRIIKQQIRPVKEEH